MERVDIYAVVFDKHPQPAWIVDAETGDLLAVNEAALEYCGCTREAFIPPAAGEKLELITRDIGLEGRPARLTVARDTSAEARLRTYLESASEGVVAVDGEGRIEFVNARIEEMFGYRREEMLGKALEELLPERHREAHSEHRTSYAAGPRRRPMGAGLELTGRRKDGSEFPVEVGLSAAAADAGVTQIAFVNDITVRKGAEDALRESEARLARAQSLARLGHWEQDVSSGELWWSEEVYRIFEAPAGKPPTRAQFYERVHPEDRQAVQAAVERATATGTPYSMEHRIVLPGGGERYVREFAEVIRDERGTRLLGAVQDITEYKKLEEQLRQSQRMEAVGRLAGGVAHDFNNLLTIISGYTELLLKRLAEGSPERHDLHEIAHAAARAASLTKQLLAFSRRQIQQLKILNLNTVVADLDKMLRRLIGEDVELTASLAEDLGLVRADPAQMEQVIMNLVVNARDAMPRGGRLVIETANVELDENYVSRHGEGQAGPHTMLAVTDSGTGMTPETMEHIFEPFFTTKPREKGTGLGLSTVYGIVKQSGGSIYVYSEPGRGTSFKVYFPRVEQQPAAPRVQAEAPAARGHGTVLIVEDEEGVRALIRTILENQGYEVLEATSGEQALEFLEGRAGEVDLMITDVVMPEMGGLDLFRAAAALVPRIRVLFISGYTDETIVQHGVPGRAVPFLQKPFTHDALARKVREVLES